jgi:hypothetical protein
LPERGGELRRAENDGNRGNRDDNAAPEEELPDSSP